MEEVTKPFLISIAELVAGAFPELEGRAIAVMDARPTKDNMPTIPVAFIAPNREQATDAWRSSSNIQLADSFVVEFWLTPIKEKRRDGTETPFWAYYDWESIRDGLVDLLKSESMARKQNNWGIQYSGVDFDVDPHAVILTFLFIRNYIWCPPEREPGEPIKFRICLDPAQDSCCEPDEGTPEC